MTDYSDTLDVALFPIPNVVAFPGTVLPLHVFEPRYRQLVHDCVRDDRLVAVSHTLKTIHEPKKQHTLEEAMRSNQATYRPTEVFSAGCCEIAETTADGRIMVKVLMSERLLLVDDIQSLPYRIVSCVRVQDDDSAMTAEDDRALQKSINAKLKALIAVGNAEFAEQLDQPAWTALTPSEYSFRIFQFVRFDADVMQTILEARSANERLGLTWNHLQRA